MGTESEAEMIPDVFDLADKTLPGFAESVQEIKDFSEDPHPVKALLCKKGERAMAILENALLGNDTSLAVDTVLAIGDRANLQAFIEAEDIGEEEKGEMAFGVLQATESEDAKLWGLSKVLFIEIQRPGDISTTVSVIAREDDFGAAMVVGELQKHFQLVEEETFTIKQVLCFARGRILLEVSLLQYI